MDTALITIETGKFPFMAQLGVDVAAMMRLAGLPMALLSQPTSRLTVDQYRAFLCAVEELAPTPDIPITIGRATVSGTFHPVAFAALCSSSFVVAAGRVRDHTRLCVPKTLALDDDGRHFTVTWRWNVPAPDMPFGDTATPSVFMVELLRVATRRRVVPVRVVFPLPAPGPAFAKYFGVAPEVGPLASLTFSREDATRPFLTANEAMWEAFAPELRRQISRLGAQAPLQERVRTHLLECLPSGEASADTIAQRMGMSRRTLSRQLSAEDTTFRAQVQAVRHQLAHHYLKNTTISYGEIAFLLGYNETSSFFRAFKEWTGQTPETTRCQPAAH